VDRQQLDERMDFSLARHARPERWFGTYNYRYETTFDLTGFYPNATHLAGRWATDNQGVDILINGVSTGQPNTAQFVSWTPFQITSGFVAGINRLTFVVNNGGPGAPPGADPTGLRAEVGARPARLRRRPHRTANQH